MGRDEGWVEIQFGIENPVWGWKSSLDWKSSLGLKSRIGRERLWVSSWSVLGERTSLEKGIQRIEAKILSSPGYFLSQFVVNFSGPDKIWAPRPAQWVPALPEGISLIFLLCLSTGAHLEPIRSCHGDLHLLTLYSPLFNIKNTVGGGF